MLFLDSVEERLDVVSLDAPEYHLAIREAATAGIVGGTIYDALLGRCALKANVNEDLHLERYSLSEARR